jgi:hypothetical protein
MASRFLLYFEYVGAFSTWRPHLSFEEFNPQFVDRKTCGDNAAGMIARRVENQIDSRND